jgi:hypothetical protein
MPLEAGSMAYPKGISSRQTTMEEAMIALRHAMRDAQANLDRLAVLASNAQLIEVEAITRKLRKIAETA